MDTPFTDNRSASAARYRYWSRVRNLTVGLLCLWFAVNLIVIFFARELASLTLGGWPIPFYMAAQGTTLIYLLIIGIYTRSVNRMEREVSATENRKDGHEVD
jgi:putative solute:sodium symporter small subunit